MNNKGQIGLGMIFVTLISVVVGLALFTPSAQYVGTATTLGQATNSTYTLPANGTTQDLTVCGQLNTTAVTINNYTNSAGVAGNGGAGNASLAGNFTISQAVGSSGYLQTRVRWDSLGAAYIQAGYLTNVTCQFQPMGYITDSGGRSIATLIIIFAALSVAAVALAPVVKQRFLD